MIPTFVHITHEQWEAMDHTEQYEVIKRSIEIAPIEACKSFLTSVEGQFVVQGGWEDLCERDLRDVTQLVHDAVWAKYLKQNGLSN